MSTISRGIGALVAAAAISFGTLAGLPAYAVQTLPVTFNPNPPVIVVGQVLTVSGSGCTVTPDDWPVLYTTDANGAYTGMADMVNADGTWTLDVSDADYTLGSPEAGPTPGTWTAGIVCGSLQSATVYAKYGPFTFTVLPVPGTAAKSVITLPKLYLVAGKSATLPAAVQPYSAKQKGVTWSSANPGVATVDANGKVTAGKKMAGKSTTITVTSVDGKFTAQCKVYVVAKATTLKSFKTPVSKTTGLVVGGTMQIKPTLSPAKATGIVPTYSSSKTTVAVIDSLGVIKALLPGQTTITVKAGGKTKTFVLTVGMVAPTKITLNNTKVSLAKGKKLTLQVKTWAPTNADPQTVIWSSSNTKIATVNSNGVITAKKKGKVTITVTTWNGKTAKCVVTVK